MRIGDYLRSGAMALLILLGTMASAQGGDIQLPQLMHRLAEAKSRAATFVEKQYIGVLDRPIVSTGDLSFVAPDRIKKRTRTPKPETITLAGHTLTIDRPGQTPTQFDIEDHPGIAAFIESLRGTLAGDLPGLRAYYAVEVTGSMDEWRLTLTPKQNQQSHLFEHIVIRGSHANILAIELDQHNGDHSVMVITPGNTVR